VSVIFNNGNSFLQITTIYSHSMSDLNVNKGDVLVSRIQHAGCSYYHIFVRVEKKLPSGKYRVHPLQANQVLVSNVDAKNGFTQIVPGDIDLMKPTFLISSSGYKSHPGTWTGFNFIKYNDSMEIKNYYDIND
jgi:hypothetical protein